MPRVSYVPSEWIADSYCCAEEDKWDLSVITFVTYCYILAALNEHPILLSSLSPSSGFYSLFPSCSTLTASSSSSREDAAAASSSGDIYETAAFLLLSSPCTYYSDYQYCQSQVPFHLSIPLSHPGADTPNQLFTEMEGSRGWQWQEQETSLHLNRKEKQQERRLLLPVGVLLGNTEFAQNWWFMLTGTVH